VRTEFPANREDAGDEKKFKISPQRRGGTQRAAEKNLLIQWFTARISAIMIIGHHRFFLTTAGFAETHRGLNL
jgi:hypothetical protein